LYRGLGYVYKTQLKFQMDSISHAQIERCSILTTFRLRGNANVAK
jgi:hypothetical protein